MKTRKLKDLTVSEIGMGCMAFSHGYGQIPDESYSVEAIRMALDHGCDFFDTAEGYGPELKPEHRGHNEKILGRAVFPQTPAEARKPRQGRSLFSCADIKKGEVFTAENVRSIRPGNGIRPKYLSEMLGKKAGTALPFGQPVTQEFFDGLE